MTKYYGTLLSKKLCNRNILLYSFDFVKVRITLLRIEVKVRFIYLFVNTEAIFYISLQKYFLGEYGHQLVYAQTR